MQDPTVEKLFTEQIEHYSKSKTAGKSPLIELFNKWYAAQPVKKKLEIGEFGGAAGQLLAAIDNICHHSNLTNIEIVAGYERNQVLKKIKFINGSVLDSNLPDGYFDVLIMRDVLHHLIGQNLAETRANQLKALKEIKRLLRPEGIILIEELTNKSAFICKLIYHLSRINSKIGIRAPKWEISPNTIVAPLTPAELSSLFAQELKIQTKTVLFKRPRPWRSWLTHLFSAYGKYIVVAKK